MSARPDFRRLEVSAEKLDAAIAAESEQRKLQHVLAADLSDALETFDDELVEGLIGRMAMAVLYGDSNSGKTFAAIDLGAAICQGLDWLGRPTAKGLVVYLATEAQASVQMRLRAYQRHHRVKLYGFVIVQSPINLFDGMADVAAVIELVASVEREHGCKVALIIGDTLARIAAGANENSGQDMAVVLRNADAIRVATLAAFLWIHHTGKDAAKGMRGWSGMRAAIDTEIEIVADDATGLRSLEVTKQRDLPGKGTRLGFRLISVPLGVNRWGTERGSCVLEPTDAPAKTRGKRPSEIAGAIVEFLTARNSGCARGALVKHFEGRYVRASVYKEVAKLVDNGMLIECAGVVALPGRPGAGV